MAHISMQIKRRTDMRGGFNMVVNAINMQSRNVFIDNKTVRGYRIDGSVVLQHIERHFGLVLN